MLLSEKSMHKAAHLAPRKTLDGSCTAVCSLTPVQFTEAEKRAKCWHGLGLSVPAAVHSKNAQIPATLRGLKAEIPDLPGIDALADRGWKGHYRYHYLKHTL